jgi:hypothetical protein
VTCKNWLVEGSMEVMYAYKIVGEGRQLFKSTDRNVLDPSFLALVQQSVIYLPCQKGCYSAHTETGVQSLTSAKNVLSDISGKRQCVGMGIRYITLEMRASNHFSQLRASMWVTQQRFGKKEDELRNTDD